MKLRNENLRLQQNYFKTDEFLELQARSLLNKARAGEHLVLLPKFEGKGTGSVTDAGSPSGSTTVKKSNFEQWMDFLLGQGSR
jgi:hypothetical protein